MIRVFPNSPYSYILLFIVSCNEKQKTLTEQIPKEKYTLTMVQLLVEAGDPEANLEDHRIKTGMIHPTIAITGIRT